METKNVVISKEYVEKIKRFAAIKPEEEFNYIPVAYRGLPDDIKPIFKLKPVSGEKVLCYSDMMSGEVTMINGSPNIKVQRGKFSVNIVKEGLVSWENYYSINGDIVPFNDNILPLSRALIEELAEAILNYSQLSEEEILGLK